VAQMLAIFLLLLHNPVADFPVREVGYVLIYAAAALTLWSMVIYLRAAWPKLLGNSDN
ncbi:MAG: CDP-diacylglycerol--glycerol-3-phosphate 3-phosphatidyltransferase, partial [Gammaproteobacteria bacterium]|nr:CDP-diacylglycerol--glycerol-3-phosphate 3-phosphatidyltransferase [Gammaproteobacteria bacterium]